MKKGLLLLAAVAAVAIFVDVAVGSSITSYRQTPGSSPRQAAHMKVVRISNTSKGVITIAVWLANRPGGNTKVGDNISIGLDTDANRATGSSTGADYALSYTRHRSSHPVTAVMKRKGGTWVTDLSFNAAFGKTIKVVPYGAKGSYLAWRFPRSLLKIGNRFRFWVLTMYGCKGGSHAGCIGGHEGEYLPRAENPGVLTYRLK